MSKNTQTIDGLLHSIHKTKAEKSSPNYPCQLDNVLVPIFDTVQAYVDNTDYSEADLCSAIRKSIAITEQAKLRRIDNPKSGKMPIEFVVDNTAKVFAEDSERYTKEDGTIDSALLQADIKALWETM